MMLRRLLALALLLIATPALAERVCDANGCTFTLPITVNGQITTTQTTGSPPFVVSSTTQVPNLYVARAVLADTFSTSGNNAWTGNETHSGTELFTGALYTFGANGQAAIGASSTNGALFGGQGSTYDTALTNKSGTLVAVIPTGTQQFQHLVGGTSPATVAATSNYGLLTFNGSTALVGMLGVFGGASGDAGTLYISAPTSVSLYGAGTLFRPYTDNATSLGSASARWAAIYGTAYYTGSGTAGITCNAGLSATTARTIGGIVTAC